ncbi:hypothetical protein CC86DRAFT_396432 [Ophiobolus disseminans]|uniref:Uncharacterized protein n=1 Tax=Ophiobolus disseminans TaxID=1469910 RepID=A0A6A6ZPY7_9PLEO|nr:hypothetical protein CC86DRAFT_396432 [Ophiobolus disseminans]
MSLPRELRNMVYDFIIKDLPKIINVSKDRLLASVFQLAMQGTAQTIVGGSTQYPLVTFLPGVAYVNNTIYTEFVPAYLSKIYLKVGASPDFLYLENFFETLPNGKGWDNILNLSLLNLASLARSPARANEVMDTIIGARALQVLVINFRLQDLYLPPDWRHPPCSREEALEYTNNPAKTAGAKYLMEQYEFHRLFAMKHLKRIIIKVEHGFFQQTPRSNCILGDLADVIRDGFRAASGVIDASVQQLTIAK